MSIILDHLYHTYEKGTNMEVHALKDINLKIEDGEFVGLIGHTGSGKSSLIQHLNGLLKPTSGTVYVDGRDIWDSDYSLKDLRSRVGLVFQYPEHQLFEEDVIKDVCFGPMNLGMSRKDAELKAYKALEQVGFPRESIYKSPFELSGGQKRRVAIAGVLAMDPGVMILDEPTAGLDPRGRDEILDLLAGMHADLGITVILVSHSMEDVARYVSRIVVMNGGSIFLDGSPREVFAHRQELEGVGLSAPAVTYIMEELAGMMPVNTAVTTLEEASEEILRLVRI